MQKSHAPKPKLTPPLPSPTSQNFDPLSGMYVPVFTFEEAFPHHVEFVWMVAQRTPQNLKNKEAFRDYVRGYEARATFPHHETIHRIAECIDALQVGEHESICMCVLPQPRQHVDTCVTHFENPHII